MAQLAYPIDAPIGFEGMPADTQLFEARSFFSEEASAEIPFGRMLQQGTQDRQCKLLTAIANRLVGISIFSHSYEPGPLIGGITPKDSVSVLHKGTIWVICEEAFTPSSVVHVRGLAGAGAVGRFRATADASNTLQVYGAHYLNSGAAGGLAKLYFDLEAHLSH